MKKLTTIAALLATLGTGAIAAAAETAQPASEAQAKAALQELKLARLSGRAMARVIYRGVTLIDGVGTGPAPAARSDMAIVIDGELIKAIVPATQLDKAMADGAEVIDAHGMFALPGLIDSHVHYATQPVRATAEAELKRNIYGGLTGVRDMAGDARALADWSRAALINEITSPDIFFAALVAGPSFFQDPRTQSSSQGMQPGQAPWMYAVTAQTRLPLAIAQARGTGATGLKIYANLPGKLVRQLIAEGKRQSFPVWTHQQVYPATPYDSLGATSVSHVCMIGRYVRDAGKDRYGHANEPSYAGLTAADTGIQKYIAALAKSGSIMDATLSVYIPAPAVDGKPAPSGRCPIQLAGDLTHTMQLAGVPIVAGTDTDTVADDPYPALYGELDALVRYAGFTPYQAIVAATRTAAAALGKEREFGTLEPGKFANIALFRDDPTQNIANLHSVVLTVKRGNRFARSDYHFQPIPLPADE